MKGELSERQLLGRAARHGYHPTHEQVKRWVRAGLLPRPEQKHLPGLRGSESHYPERASAQLIALCRLRQEERRLDELTFRLWWEGYEVEPSRLRTALVSIVHEQVQTLEDLFGQDDWLQTLENGARARTRHPLIRLLRSRLGHNSDDLLTVLATILPAAHGGESPVWENVTEVADEPSPEQIVAKGLGLDKVSRTYPGVGALAPEGASAEQSLSWLPEAGFGELLDALAEASDEELQAARGDAQVFTEDLVPIVRAMELVLGRDAMGLGFVLVFDTKDRDVWRWRAGLIALFVHLRRQIPGENLEQVSSAIREASPPAKAFLKEWQRNQGIVKEAKKLLGMS